MKECVAQKIFYRFSTQSRKVAKSQRSYYCLFASWRLRVFALKITLKIYLLNAFFLGGCAVGPNYQPPETSISDTWNADATVSTEPPVDKWWETFHDNLLNRYIDLASEHNYDLQVAEANILKAKALRQMIASKLFPQVSADINGVKTYFSKNGPVFEIGQAAGNPTDVSSVTTGLPFVLQIPQIQNLFNALLDASWELDLFGKTRRSVEAAQAEYESLIDRRNGVLLSTQAEVARNYIDLRASQRREQLVQKQIELSETHAAITRLSVQFGYSNQLDLETIEAELALAKAALPNTYSEIYRAIYTLSILIGKPPETLVDELLIPRPLPEAPQTLTVGLRSDLLRRRPDIRYAERQLAEATANIGVAIASFFPTTTLAANGGFQSLVLPKLFEWGSRTWAYGADVNMPLFQGGRLVGQLQLSRADQAMKAASYQQTVLNAFQDAENSLKKYQEWTKATKEYDKNVLHHHFVVAITQERFRKGLINKIDLLNNEKQLVSAELMQLDSQTAELTSLVTLYKALGGNWDAKELVESAKELPTCDQTH
jgi:NodT family efflux transporter outer membrane factor (OMF) lipoprotein